jgi:peptide/nickel transport system substrate-binding protein
VEFDLYTNAGSLERESIGVMIKQDLEDLGMKVNFKPIEFNTLVNKLSNTNDWDMTIIGLTGSPLEPHDGKNVWLSTGTLHLFNQRPANYKIDDRFDWEKELDEIFERGALELDFEKRKPIYDRYQEIIYEQNPIIYLYSPIRIVAVRKKIKNIFPSKLSGLIHNLDEVYISK